MGTAIKLPVPDRVKPSFVIFDAGHSDAAQGMLYSRIHMATVGVKGLTLLYTIICTLLLPIGTNFTEDCVK